MRLKILTRERVVLDEEEVEAVYARSTEGEFGVLAKHLPLAAPLAISLLTYERQKQRSTVAVMGGLFSTDGQSVTVLSDSAELSSEIDEIRARDAKQRAESRLKEQRDSLDMQRAQLSLERALIRLQVIQKKG